MNTSIKRAIGACGAFLLAGAMALGVTVPASAATTEPTSVTVGMNTIGYDAEIAKANGYEVRTDAAGQQYSVAVTPSAIAAEKKYKASQKGTYGTQATVNGNCGSSTFLISREGGTREVRIGTAFRVSAPTAFHIWNVSLISKSGVTSVNFDGGPTSGSWNATRENVNVGLNQGVVGQVTTGSYAALINGRICYSGGPKAGV